MIKIKEAIIVEGKYDKIKLSTIFETLIIETNGFSIFKDRDKMHFIKQFAEKNGIVVLTDSDQAGFMIRSHIKGCIENKYIINVYIPDIYGKEQRKIHYSKEGKIGVEGIDNDIIVTAFERAGVVLDDKAFAQSIARKITTSDLFEDGIMGTAHSTINKAKLVSELNFPEHISTSALLKSMNI